MIPPDASASGGYFALRNQFGNDHEAYIIGGSIHIAGGKREELVTVSCVYAGVIQGMHPAVIDILPEGDAISLDKIVIGEIYLGDINFKNRKNLVGAMFIECVEINIGIGLVEFFAFVLVQISEHGAIAHIVTIKGHIVRGGMQICPGMGVNGTVSAVRLVEVPFKIEIGVIGGP